MTRVLSRVVSIATMIFALAIPSAHAFFDPPMDHAGGAARG
jgi:hypothetical protein